MSPPRDLPSTRRTLIKQPPPAQGAHLGVRSQRPRSPALKSLPPESLGTKGNTERKSPEHQQTTWRQTQRRPGREESPLPDGCRTKISVRQIVGRDRRCPEGAGGSVG